MLTGLTHLGQVAATVSPIDTSTAPSLAGVLALPDHRREWVALFHLWNRDTKAEEVLGISSSGKVTVTGDSVPNVGFQGLLRNALRVSTNVLSGSGLASKGQASRGDLEIENGDRQIDAYLSSPYAWGGRQVEVFVGRRRDEISLGTLPFSDFSRVFDGEIVRHPSGGDKLKVKIRDKRERLEKPIQSRVFRGLGGGWRADGTNDFGEAQSSTLHALASVPITVTAYIRRIGLSGDSFELVAGKPNNWDLAFVEGDDVLRFRFYSGTNRYEWELDDLTQVEGKWLVQVTFCVDALTQDGGKWYIDGELFESTAFSNTLDGTVSYNTPLRVMGNSATAFQVHGDIGELRIYDRVVDRPEILADLNRQIPKGTAGLRGLWRFNNATAGGTAVSELTHLETRYGMEFNLTGEAGVIASHSDFDLDGGSFTWEALALNRIGTGARWLVARDGQFRFGYNGDKLRIEIHDGTSYQTVEESTGSLETGQEVHVAFTWDLNDLTARGFVEGVEVISVTTTAIASSVTTDIGIAADDAAASQRWRGPIFMVRGWSSIRTTSELQRWAREVLVDLTGVVVYHDFSDQTGTTSTDQTTNSHDATSLTGIWESSDIDLTGGDQVTTYEGGDDLAGKPWPLSLGRVREVEAVQISTLFNIWAVHRGSVEDIQSVKVGGSEWTDEGDSTDLSLASVTSGANFKTDESRGLLKLGQVPSGKVTVTLKGDNSGGYVETTADVMKKIAVDYAGLVDPDEIEGASFLSLAAEDPSVVGYHVGTKSVSSSRVMDRLMAALTGWWDFTHDGLLEVKRLPSVADWNPTKTLTEDDVVDLKLEDSPSVIYQETLGYQRVWTDLSREDLNTGTLTEDEIEFLTKTLRTLHEDRPDVLEDHADAISSSLETYFDELGDVGSVVSEAGTVETGAGKEKVRRRDFFFTERKTYSLLLREGLFDFNLGQVLELELPYWDLSNGKVGIVLGVKVRAKESQVLLRVFV